ncbi:MAG: hypothetical protein KUF72_12520 [Candidatus Thiodiazotropha sp. (ex Ctena orbiculata)]|nr:hypothetical protein [Candidatus Thiodiazotropha taylori]
MTDSIHDAAIALNNIYDRLHRIHASSVLIDLIRSKEVERIDANSSIFTDFASENLSESIRGIFDECETIQEHLESLSGIKLDELKR